ncbi:SDR family NAD(P)-dependent oxidoreductase [Deinococcus sp.]|uniref:SDR family NAD(P)-dependent oxidoreductase n=1 Tax=Deinococcus sp. TaxID=47478 RepID=UPI003B59CAC5
MQLTNKTVVVTGSASGIGKAMVERFIKEGATVIASDRSVEAGQREADAAGARFVAADVSHEKDIQRLIEEVWAREGEIDLFCSNAGIGLGEGPETPDAQWRLIHNVNVMSHVWAARHLLPRMLERGGGYFLNTVSAAGLLTELHSAPYSVTKHAALAFAEWLSIAYGDQGIKVTCLCPEGVWTPMIANLPALQLSAVTPEVLIEAAVQALREERFLVTTHDTTLKGFQLKAQDYDGWIGKMRRLRVKAVGMLQGAAPADKQA